TRNRIAVGIEGRMAELRGNQLLDLLRENMLEHLRLRMHPLPAHTEALDEEELEQAVMADHLERDEAASLGQADTMVRLVLDETEAGELARHPRDRRGCDVEAVGQRVRRCRLAAALEHVDRLDVVLDR